MPVQEQLRTCLHSLTTHCESLLVQNETLSSENEALRTRLDALRPRSRGQEDICRTQDSLEASAVIEEVSSLDKESDLLRVAEPPGMVPDHQTSWAAVVPESSRGPQWLVPVGPLSRQSRREPNARMEEDGGNTAKRAAVETALLTDSRAGRTFSSSILDEEIPAAIRNLTVNSTKSKKGAGTKPVGDESLSAARLGWLSLNQRRKTLQNGTFIDTLSAFTVSIFEEDVPQGGIFKTVVKSPVFRCFCTTVIAANTIFIGFAADYQVKNSIRRFDGLEKEAEWKTPDIFFTTWFSIELALRIAADKKLFFIGEDYRWNLFDCFLVANSILDLSFPDISNNFSFLRILRVFRVVRVVRVVKSVKALRSLRTMVFALINSFLCLMWAFVMMILVMFVFGVTFNNAISGYFDALDVSNPDHQRDAQRVRVSFGSLYETMVTLLCSITGGNDWMQYGELLRLLEHGELWFVIFYFYICFCMVGMLNVITGIFVDSAVCTRTEDEVVECFTEDQRRTSEEVRRIFKEADTNKSGTLSYQELAKHLENPWVKAYFSGLDIDPSEAGIIFTLIDTDGSDCISIDEFVDGTMKLKGHAKSIDVLSIMFDSVRFSLKFNQLCTFVEDELRDIKQVLLPNATPRSNGAVSHSFPATPCLAAENKFTGIRPASATRSNVSDTKD